MAGNLIFCFRKRKRNITMLKLAQIYLINTSFDQKLNEESENYHTSNFLTFFNIEIIKNSF